MNIIKFIFLLFVVKSTSQEVTGFIYNNDNPIPYVNVFKKDLSASTVSDENGKFTLEVEKGDIIIFSHIGMRKKEMKIKNFKPLNVKLKTKPNILEEIRLKSIKNNRKSNSFQSRFGEISKRSAGYSIYSLDKERIQNSTGSLAQALVGKIPGYRLNPNGVYLRSYGLSLTPAIWDIDGTIYSGGLSDSGGGLPDFIDVSLVESVHVINAGAGTALYGSRASGGVIIVNTIKNYTKNSYKKSYPQLYFVKPNKFELPKQGKEISEIIKGDINALRLMSFIYKNRGNPKLALRVNRLILTYEPNNFISFRDIAESLLETNNKNKAWHTYIAFIQRNETNIDKTLFDVIFHDMERLYHSYNLKKTVGNKFVSEKKTHNTYKNETRVVFEWTVPNQFLEVELINPKNQSINFQLGNGLFKDSNVEEFFIDETYKGIWKLNLSILEEVKLDGYLKVTIYRNWISQDKTLPESKFFLLSGVKHTKYKLLDLKI